MKTAAAAGLVEVLAPGFPAGAEFGLQVVVHATSPGPRQAAAVSETVVDGIIAAFHGRPGARPCRKSCGSDPRPAASQHDSARVGGPRRRMRARTAVRLPAFVVKGTYVQISLCDDQCQAGEVTIQPGANGPYPEISGELFALRRTPA